jgi:hypothetical protein
LKVIVVVYVYPYSGLSVGAAENIELVRKIMWARIEKYLLKKIIGKV